MGKTTPQSAGSGMKQKSISSFFAAKPKASPAPAAAAKNTGSPAATAAAAAGAAGGEGHTTPKQAVARTPPPAAAAATAANKDVKADAATPALVPAKAAPSKGPSAGAAAAAAQATPGPELVGCDVKVFWPLDKACFKGTVTQYREKDAKHYVSYEDGDAEWLDLASESFKVLPAGAGTAAAAAGGGARKRPRAAAAAKKRRAARVLADSDDDDGDADQDSDEADEDDSGADSDFKAGGDGSEDDDELMDELEDEEGPDDGDSGSADQAECEDEDELCDEGVGTAGSKRKRNSSSSSKVAVGRKRAAAAPSSSAATAAAATPASAAGTEGAGGCGAPSSAGHTPMDRFGFAAGKSTPPQGSVFPSLTPPSGARCSSPDLSGFRGPPQPSPAAPAGDTPATGGRGTPATPGPPDSAAKAALQGKLDLTPAAQAGKPEPRMVLGVVASGGSEAARFAARMAERFSFLHPNRIKDKAGRSPDDPQYNPRTLRIPGEFFKANKVTEAQQQWWGFKADNFDSVLLFKVGKFYEMFEMDAFVGVDVLGLSFMKGDQPHAGFPEAAYHGMAEQLARAGYRVVVVEQTETPEQLKARNAKRPPGTKMVNVVQRQAVAVLSRGTLIDPEMVAAHPDAAYVLAVVESAEGGGHDAPFIGVCALDTAAGQLLVGAWRDDEVRLKLRTQLTGLRPVEVVLPRRGSGSMSAVTSRLVRCGASRGPEPALNELPASDADPDDALKVLSKYFPDADSLPPLLQQLKQQYTTGTSSATTGTQSTPAAATGAGAAAGSGDSAAAAAAAGADGSSGGSQSVDHVKSVSGAALGAVGLMVSFLRSNMLDAALLPHAKYEQLCEGVTGSDEPVAMELNGAALEGLEVLENALGGTQGSLLGLLDHCATPFGRRRLRRWLTRPLYRISDINRRQDAVGELMGPLDGAVGAARRALAGTSDLERCLARLAASVGGGSSGSGSSGGGFGRDAAHVVLYEDVGRRRVRVLVGAMKDLQGLQAALEAFQQANPTSELLVALTEAPRWSDFGTKLGELSAAADWGKAEADGVVRPSRKGVDAAYDEATAAVEAAEAELQDYLVRVRKQLDCRSISYTSLNKESHVLEVPEAAAGRMPASFSLVGHRKGFKRYSSEELAGLVADKAAAEEERERVEAGVLRNLERLFVSHQELWASAIEAVGVLDCLMALAGAALAADGTMCRPKLLPHTLDADGRPSGGLFKATQLRHPAGIAGAACGSFVPNNVCLGGDAPGFILLTGPNMGGKSTLLRQVCLAAVLAQVGAFVPAEALELTPMDGCFVRMGARDAILSGQSTFYIEMAETAAMLNRASPASLVALDELGRGTATLDGAAIAAAVLDHLAHTSRCCGLFATHYHQLAAEHAADPQVAIMHMACAVAEQQQPADAAAGAGAAAAASGESEQQQQEGRGPGAGEENVAEVTFLYKLTPGACPKSYGTNVARLAGLPASVVARAGTMSASREAIYAAGHQQHNQQQRKQQQQVPGSAGAAAADTAEAMDLDSVEGRAGGVELQQLVGSIRGCLKQLEGGAHAAGEGQKAVQEKLLQLQQQAAMLCK